MRRSVLAITIAASLSLALAAFAAIWSWSPQHVTISTVASTDFGDITVAKPDRPTMAAVLFYDPPDKEKITTLGVSLARFGTATFSVDNSRFLTGVASHTECRFIGGDAERLTQALEEKVGITTYFPPIFIGVNGSASTAYAAYMHVRHNVPAAVAWNLCSVVPPIVSICRTDELTFAQQADGSTQMRATHPFDEDFVIHGRMQSSPPCGDVLLSAQGAPNDTLESVAQQVAETAAERFSAKHSPMPIEELPAISENNKYVAVFISGDGGWAGLDQDTGRYLSEHNIGVIGVSALKYFWKRKSPSDAAVAIDALFRQYGEKWHSDRFLLIGYSLGADVAPFIYNRLPEDTRAKVERVVSIAPERRCDFQVHITDWIGFDKDDSGDETLPEVTRIPPHRFLCLYAKEDETGICHDIDRSQYLVREFPGNHHFDGDYQRLGKTIVDSLAD